MKLGCFHVCLIIIIYSDPSQSIFLALDTYYFKKTPFGESTSYYITLRKT